MKQCFRTISWASFIVRREDTPSYGLMENQCLETQMQVLRTVPCYRKEFKHLDRWDCRVLSFMNWDGPSCLLGHFRRFSTKLRITDSRASHAIWEFPSLMITMKGVHTDSIQQKSVKKWHHLPPGSSEVRHPWQKKKIKNPKSDCLVRDFVQTRHQNHGAGRGLRGALKSSSWKIHYVRTCVKRTKWLFIQLQEELDPGREAKHKMQVPPK